MSEQEHKRDVADYRDSDEIDLFELLKTLWQWKWFVVALTALGIILGFLYVGLKQVRYQAQAKVQVGKVLDVPIESAGDIDAYLQSDEFHSNLSDEGEIRFEINGKVEINENEYVTKTILITLSSTAGAPEGAKQRVGAAVDAVLSRHTSLYHEAMRQYKEYKPQLKKLPGELSEKLPLMWLESYTYPTKVINSPSVSQNSPDKIAVPVAAVAALFLAILLVFLIDGLRTRIRDERKGCH